MKKEKCRKNMFNGRKEQFCLEEKIVEKNEKKCVILYLKVMKCFENFVC